MFSTWEGVQYIEDTMSTLGRYLDACGDIMSISGDIMMHVGEQVGKNLSISIENPDVLNIPQCTHDIPQCTHDIPQCTHDIPPDVLTLSSDVLNTP